MTSAHLADDVTAAHDRAVDLPPLVRRRDLHARGCTDSETRRALAGLERLAAGTYASTDGLTRAQSHVLTTAAVLERLSNVVASHVSAAVLWGLPTVDGHLDTVQLSPTPKRRGRPKSRSGYRMHSRVVAPMDTRHVRGLPVTDPVLTIMDCARSLDLDWAVTMADAALRHQLVTQPELHTAAMGLTRLPGVSRARQLPGLASPLAESPGESLLRQRLLRMGFTVREQVVIGTARVDLLVRQGIVIEFDGRAKYELEGDPARAHWAEKRRHDGLVELGYEVMHVSWADLWDERALENRVRRALNRWDARQG